MPIEQTIGAGDAENDLSMLVHAGIGVAMGTASDAVKAQADYAAPSVDEDGIAHTLSPYSLIPEPELPSSSQLKFTNCYWNYPSIRCTI